MPPASPPVLTLIVTYYDFPSSHADFQRGCGYYQGCRVQTGLVEASLTSHGKPVCLAAYRRNIMPNCTRFKSSARMSRG